MTKTVLFSKKGTHGVIVNVHLLKGIDCDENVSNVSVYQATEHAKMHHKLPNDQRR